MHLLTLALLTLPAAEPAALPAQTWPAFRGTGNSITAAENLPLTWSDKDNLAWTADLPGYGQSSPVVWKDRVFVTAVEGDFKDKLHLLCLERSTGKILWKKQFEGTQKVKASSYVSHAAPTPAVDSERVYAVYESGDVFALDHAGKLVWQRSLTKEYGEFKNNHGLGSSPALCPEALVILVAHNGPGYLLALDPASGKNRWKLDRDYKASWTSPVILDGNLVLVSSNGLAEAVRVTDGKGVWEADMVSGNTVASPSAEGNLVVIAGSERGAQTALKLGQTGKLDGNHVAWKSETITSSFGSPLVLDGRVYTVNKAGIAHCTDLKTGEKLWDLRLPASCWASPLGARDRVYFFSTDGVCTVLKAGPKLEKLADNRLTPGDRNRVYGVAAVEGTLLIRTGTKLFCVGKS